MVADNPDVTPIVIEAADIIEARLDHATHAQLMEWAGRSSIGEPANRIVCDLLDNESE